MKKNKPNIISNELDQAPKTGKHYFERLQNPELKNQIKEAFSYEFIVGNDSNEEINNEMVDRLGKHEKDIPLKLVTEQLSEHKKVSILYHKQNIKEKKGAEWHVCIGPLMGAEHQFHKLGLSFNRKNEGLSEGELGTFLTFERNEYGQIVVGAEQIEIPEGPFTMDGLAAHKKLDLSEFLEYIKEEESKKEEVQGSNKIQENVASSEQTSDSGKGKSRRSKLFGKK